MFPTGSGVLEKHLFLNQEVVCSVLSWVIPKNFQKLVHVLAALLFGTRH